MTTTIRGRVLLIGAAVLVAAVAAGTLAAIIIGLRGQHSEPPRLAAYADGRTVSVPPYRYCPVQEPLCDSERGPTVDVAVREHHPLQLSVPSEVSDAPWLLASFYDAGPALVEQDQWFDSGQAPSAVTVAPIDDQGRPLVGVEVRLPAGIIDIDTGQETIVSHAVWSIRTTPGDPVEQSAADNTASE